MAALVVVVGDKVPLEASVPGEGAEPCGGCCCGGSGGGGG